MKKRNEKKNGEKRWGKKVGGLTLELKKKTLRKTKWI